MISIILWSISPCVIWVNCAEKPEGVFISRCQFVIYIYIKICICFCTSTCYSIVIDQTCIITRSEFHCIAPPLECITRPCWGWENAVIFAELHFEPRTSRAAVGVQGDKIFWASVVDFNFTLHTLLPSTEQNTRTAKSNDNKAKRHGDKLQSSPFLASKIFLFIFLYLLCLGIHGFSKYELSQIDF